MFEFEKEIMKLENRYPMVGYPYKVIAISEKAKLAFAKHTKRTGRMIPQKEIKKFIEENSDLSKAPFSGVVGLYDEDLDEVSIEAQMITNVLKKMALSGVDGIEYRELFDSYVRHVMGPLEYGKDFDIEIGKKISYGPPQGELTFADIKAL
jgi:hypothetical protein